MKQIKRNSKHKSTHANDVNPRIICDINKIDRSFYSVGLEIENTRNT